MAIAAFALILFAINFKRVFLWNPKFNDSETAAEWFINFIGYGGDGGGPADEEKDDKKDKKKKKSKK